MSKGRSARKISFSNELHVVMDSIGGLQSLTRKAGVDGVVAMAISGHATAASRIRYSTAATPEVAKAIGKVVSIATAKPRAGKGRARKAGSPQIRAACTAR